MKTWPLIVLLIITGLLSCGCQNNNEDALNHLKREVTSLKGQIESLENAHYFTNELNKLIWGDALFDPDKIAVGDSVAGMKLTAIDGDKYVFEGRKRVEGTLTIWEDAYYKDMISIAVENAKANCLPRAHNDLRPLWFALDNRDAAYEILKDFKTQDTVKVWIDHYIVDLKESEVINSATLLEAIDDSK